MRPALELIQKAAGLDLSVLLRGESGVGKSFLARGLHARRPRRHQPFVAVDCWTVSEQALERELFGYARGAFPGAAQDRAGAFEAAEGGTVLLEEVGRISLGLQSRLVRFLQDGQFERAGEVRARRANARVVAGLPATSRRKGWQGGSGRAFCTGSTWWRW